MQIRIATTCFYITSHALGDSKVRKTIGYDEFRLLHYAGDVTYNITGIVQ